IMRSVTIRDSMTSLLMKPTLVGRDTLHELDQPLKKLAYVSNHWGPLLFACLSSTSFDTLAAMSIASCVYFFA
ncbi:hypothetical protein, partial [Vibrio campbellii]|uniref:hypothetical protein n=1 Tax=Vibrio campbellii TaxID=680 RepID=UPI001BD9A628